MTPFVWSDGHIGWPLFAIIVFSVACLIVGDLLWRINRTRFRNLLLAAASAWAAGVVLIVVWSVW